MNTRAKFICEEKTEYPVGYRIKFRAVQSGSAENKEFFHYTPNGSVDLQLVKKETADQFVVGKEYYLDFSLAVSE